MLSILRSLLGSRRARGEDLEALRVTVIEELRRLQERVEDLHRKVDAWRGDGGATALLLDRLEEAERRRRQLGDQTAHLIELLGDARRGLALAEEAARRAGEEE